MPTNGGWSFAFDPDADPRRAPALWRADTAPVVLVLTSTATPALDPPLSLGHLRTICRWRSSSDEQHVVADDGLIRHRLLLKGPDEGQRSILTLAVDTALAIRLGAASRLARLATAANYRPTRLQRSRLVLLLALLDAQRAGFSKRVIAATLLYRDMRDLRGAGWKGSAERRRTHRICEEAVRLRDRGIADLLHARLRPPG